MKKMKAQKQKKTRTKMIKRDRGTLPYTVEYCRVLCSIKFYEAIVKQHLKLIKELLKNMTQKDAQVFVFVLCGK